MEVLNALPEKVEELLGFLGSQPAFGSGAVYVSNYLFYMSVSFGTSGIESTEVSKLKLYPNPVVNSLSISSDINVDKAEVYSVNGTLMLSKSGSIKSLDMSGLKSGSYLVKFYSEKEVIKQSIIKR